MIFSVENGCFGYRSKHILNQMNFSVENGEVLAVLGPNGVGKTTLLRASMGFLKWKNGRTLLDGRDMKTMSYSDIWKQIAYVPQAKGAAFSYTVEEMVLFGRCPHVGAFREPKAVDLELVAQALESVGIAWMKEKRVSEISGGELQMVLIERALVTGPKLLILDEPESNLDFKNQLIILETIQNLSKQQGIGCIFNTHYPAHALKVADKALILDKKGNVTFGPAKKVITRENMERAFGVAVKIQEFCVEEKVYQSVTALSLLEAGA